RLGSRARTALDRRRLPRTVGSVDGPVRCGREVTLTRYTNHVGAAASGVPRHVVTRGCRRPFTSGRRGVVAAGVAGWRNEVWRYAYLGCDAGTGLSGRVGAGSQPDPDAVPDGQPADHEQPRSTRRRHADLRGRGEPLVRGDQLTGWNAHTVVGDLHQHRTV